LYEALEGAQRERLVSGHKQKLSCEESAWIKSKLIEHNCIERSYALAQALSDKAIEAVSGDERLVAIINSMMKRSF
ncbi:MAG: polyprenyl synthetase family protein, partial [Thiovulaceae bacterium]|nr:polyprenyl synthetase family protein [Sulfurimonadaceae bacterium]